MAEKSFLFYLFKVCLPSPTWVTWIVGHEGVCTDPPPHCLMMKLVLIVFQSKIAGCTLLADN